MKTTSAEHPLVAKAGSVYLTLILTGIFAHFFARASIIEPGNAAVTAQNILDKNFLFRLGLVSDLVSIVSFIFLGLIFYRMFLPADKHNSRIFLAVVLVSGTMRAVNVLHQFAAQHVLSGAELLSVFSEPQLQALSLFFFNLHNQGAHIGHLFFGLWLFFLGRLLLKSDLFPGVWAKIFGYLLIAGFIGCEVDFLTYLLFPDKYAMVAAFATIPADLGELSLCVWLIFKGAIRKDKHLVVYEAINKT